MVKLLFKFVCKEILHFQIHQQWKRKNKIKSESKVNHKSPASASFINFILFCFLSSWFFVAALALAFFGVSNRKCVFVSVPTNTRADSILFDDNVELRWLWMEKNYFDVLLINDATKPWSRANLIIIIDRRSTEIHLVTIAFSDQFSI